MVEEDMYVGADNTPWESSSTWNWPPDSFWTTDHYSLSLAVQSVPNPCCIPARSPQFGHKGNVGDNVKNLAKLSMPVPSSHSEVVIASLEAHSVVKLDLLMANLGWLFPVNFTSLEMASIWIFFFHNFPKNWDEADQPVVFMIFQVLFLEERQETCPFQSLRTFLVHHDISEMIAALQCHRWAPSLLVPCICMSSACFRLLVWIVPLSPESVAHTWSGRLRRRPYQ